MAGSAENLVQAAGRRKLIQGAAGAVVLALTPHLARGATLLAVRIWPAPEYTRVAIEHDAPLRFHHFVLRDTNPMRLVVDIEGISLTPHFSEQIRSVDGADPFIARMRAGQFRPGVVRLVVELKKAVDPQVFALDPVGPYRNRLVLDLYPEGANDPLLALLRMPPEATQAPDADAPPRDALEHGAGPAPERATAPEADPPSAPTGAEASNGPADAAEPAQAFASAGPEPDSAGVSRKGARAMRRLITVAIDPGHGGEDPGAIGRRGTHEKLVTLSIGRQLAALMQEQPDYRVLMTRDADYFVPLGMRVAKARRVQADLFVSIHADAWVRSDARGSSVFALSERGASSSAAAELARQQNDADRIGGINVASRSSMVSRVVLDLSTTAQISDSLRVGDAVLHELEHVNRLHRGRVEQAGFAVLKAPTIPSILVETAFISNPDEEARLCEAGYQHQMAQALLAGIRNYFSRHPPLVRNPVG